MQVDAISAIIVMNDNGHLTNLVKLIQEPIDGKYNL